MATTDSSPASTQSTGALTALRIFAAITAVASVVQAILGLYLRTSESFAWHSTTAMIALVSSVAAAAAAFGWSRRSGNKGLFMHAASVPVLALVQYALGEMGAELVHIILGFVFLLDAVALLTLALRKPGVARTTAA